MNETCPKCGCKPVAIVEKTDMGCGVKADKSCVVIEPNIEYEYIHIGPGHCP